MKSRVTSISGWGNYPRMESEVWLPRDILEYRLLIKDRNSFIARGLGRSYGDSANAPSIIQTSYSDHFISFDKKTGHLRAEAGVSLQEILRVAVPEGWFLPVTPGTSFVTLGGAIASDVHGKNHHVAGTFGQHVLSMTMLVGNGDLLIVSPSSHPDLFHSTCGGMGLTGVILQANIQMIPIKSSQITQSTLRANSLEEICGLFDEHENNTYSVAWIDCITSGKKLGKSILLLGEHADEGDLSFSLDQKFTVPFYTSPSPLNPFTVRVMNTLYSAKHLKSRSRHVSIKSFFYPLDSIGGWNKIYGRSGFIQYQFVLPKIDGVKNLRRVLEIIVESGSASFLAVLKKFGRNNLNYLSFPIEGYTLALDFKLSEKTLKLIDDLDKMIVDMGGRIYLTKDSTMRESVFRSSYSRWEEFEEVRHKYSAVGKFASSQSQRLGLA